MVDTKRIAVLITVVIMNIMVVVKIHHKNILKK